jgi:hypothetical protein
MALKGQILKFSLEHSFELFFEMNGKLAFAMFDPLIVQYLLLIIFFDD